MQRICCQEISVTVFSPSERIAISRLGRDPWLAGEGTMPLLRKDEVEAGLALPPLARYPVYRAGLCLQQSAPEMVSLLHLVGGGHLPWWRWPHSNVILIAAAGRYTRASEDPAIQALLSWLLGRAIEVPGEQEPVSAPAVPPWFEHLLLIGFLPLSRNSFS